MKCAIKECRYCSPSRYQWKLNWENPRFPNEYFAHRGTSIQRLDLPALSGDGISGGTNEEGGSSFSERLRASGRITHNG